MNWRKCMLAKLGVQLLDENCAGIYFTQRKQFNPRGRTNSQGFPEHSLLSRLLGNGDGSVYGIEIASGEPTRRSYISSRRVKFLSQSALSATTR